MPKKVEPKLTKKQLRELAKQKKLEEERKIREEQERVIAEERRKREEELERIRLAELKYRQEESVRLKEEESQYVAFFINFNHNKEKSARSFKEKLEWQRYVNCAEIYSVEKESDINMVITLLKEKRITDEKTLNELLDMMDQGLEIVTKVNIKIVELISTNQTELIKRYKENRGRVFKIIRQKMKEVHCYILQISENIVNKKLNDLKKNQPELTSKPGKGNELKPEIQLGYKRNNFAVAYWIMAFENSGIKPTPINFKELGVMSDVPKAFFSKKLIMFSVRYNSNFIDVHKIDIPRVVENKMKFDSSMMHSPVMDLPLNGHFEIGCLNHISDSKQIGEFAIKRLHNVKESLKRMSIPNVEGTSSNFKIYILPDAMTTIEEIENSGIYYYDRSKKLWTRENIASLKSEFNEELDQDQLIASVPVMAPYTLTEPIASHFPFKNFKLEKMQNGVIKFDLQSLRIELNFEIGEGYIKLLSSSTDTLNQLENVEMRPHEMLFKLAECNVLLMPKINFDLNNLNPKDYATIFEEPIKIVESKKPLEDSEASQFLKDTDTPHPDEIKTEKTAEESPVIDTNNAIIEKTHTSALKFLIEGFKNSDVEDYCMNEIVRHCLRFSIKMSKWNSASGRETVVLKIREAYTSEAKSSPGEVGDWKTVLMSNNKCELLALTDESEAFSFTRIENTVSHLNFFVLVKNYPHLFNYYSVSEDFTERDLLLVDTLHRFLKPMCLFSFLK
jgi:hypothetical protein